MKLPRILLALVIAILAVSVGVASAHVKKFGTRVTIDFVDTYSGDVFLGEVKSRKARCERGRTVKVFRKRSGPDQQFDSSDKSDSSGDWIISDGNAAPGDYYAKVRRKVLKRNARHRHICKRARSETISVP